MLYSGLKIAGASLLVFALFLSVSLTGNTVAFLNDTEVSLENRLQAGVIGFNISSFDDEGGRFSNFSAFSTVSTSTATSTPGEEYEEADIVVGQERFEVTVEESRESLPLFYTVAVELDPKNPQGCEAMTVNTGFDDYEYSGPIEDFHSPKMFGMGEWQFLIELPTAETIVTEGTSTPAVAESILLPGALCKGSVVFIAGLSGVENDLSHTFSQKKFYAFALYNWGSVSPEVEVPAEDPVEEPAPEVIPLETSGSIEEVPSEPSPDAQPDPDLEPSPEPTPSPDPEVTPETPPETSPTENGDGDEEITDPSGDTPSDNEGNEEASETDDSNSNSDEEDSSGGLESGSESAGSDSSGGDSSSSDSSDSGSAAE